MSSDERGPFGPAPCRHEDVVAQIHALDRELHILRMRHEQLIAECAKLRAWVEADEKRSSWYYDSEKDLREIVESKRWVLITRHVIAWTAGALLSIIVFWNSVMPFLRGSEPK